MKKRTIIFIISMQALNIFASEGEQAPRQPRPEVFQEINAKVDGPVLVRNANFFRPKPHQENEDAQFGTKLRNTLSEIAWDAPEITLRTALQTSVQIVAQEATIAAIKKFKDFIDSTKADQKAFVDQLKISEKELQLLASGVEILGQKIALNNKLLKKYPFNEKIKQIVTKDNERLEDNIITLLSASSAKLSKHAETMVEIANRNLEQQSFEKISIAAVLKEQASQVEQTQESKDQ